MAQTKQRKKNKISKIISQFRKLQNKKERIGGKTLLASMIFLFFGFILLIQTSGISLIIAIIGIIIVYGYYNSYKKGKHTFEAYDVHYISSHFRNTLHYKRSEHILIEADSIVKKSTDDIVSQSKNFYNNDLIEFENLNNACNSIYDLGDNQVLIILKDGRNITSWDNISEHYYNDIKFISEDLSNSSDLSSRYNNISDDISSDNGYDFYNLFKNIEAVVIRNINYSVNDLSSMFYDCTNLKTITGLQTWDTSNVVNMSGMFMNCRNLKSFDQLKYLDTHNVKDMTFMFSYNEQLENASFMENWDVSNLEDMTGMFRGSNISDLESFSKLNFEKIKTINSLFSNCEKLTSLNGLEDFNTKNLENIAGAFCFCKNLVNIDALKNWDVNNVKKVTLIFADCKFDSIEPLKDWDTSNFKTLQGMFSGCENLRSLDGIESWNISNVTNMYGMFSQCKNITNFEKLTELDTSNVEDMGSLFSFCDGLTDLTSLKDLDVSNVRSMNLMFDCCSNLISLNGIENWDIANLEDLSHTFSTCTKLKDISALKNWDVQNVKELFCTFSHNLCLTSIEPLENWNVKNVREVYHIFDDCPNLISLKGLENWNLSDSAKKNIIFNPYNIMKDYPDWYLELSFKEFVEHQFPKKFLKNPYENIKIHYVLDEIRELSENNEKVSIKKLKENIINKRNFSEEKINYYIEIIKENTDYYEDSEGYLDKMRYIY